MGLDTTNPVGCTIALDGGAAISAIPELTCVDPTYCNVVSVDITQELVYSFSFDLKL